jgi:hypothetical protein
MAVKLTNEGIQFPDGSEQEKAGTSRGEQWFFNQCIVNNGAHTTNAHIGGNGSWAVPDDTNLITFHAWGGGGSGSGHCCHACYCDIATCGAFAGYYARKTVRKCDGDFTDGDNYTWCYGAGGNGESNDGCGCFTVCCDAPRGCASYVTGPGLTNFCAVGGKGGYQIYCTCRCNNQSNRQESERCVGMVVGENVDFASVGTQPEFFKTGGHCNCLSRTHSTSQSYGLTNGHSYNIENSMSYCGCSACCAGFNQIAQAGSSQMKSYCGNFICYCNGTPGKPGAIHIEWA